MPEPSSPDPIAPQLHVRPASGWLNDPNGVCLVDGTYHVFYQHNPAAPVHSDIHWGHASSTDLLRWREHPVALAPRPGMIDAAGCWSGCVVDDHGTPTAVYTANPDHAWNGAVVLARSDRSLERWQQDETPVVPASGAAGGVELRDPFVFSHAGHRYAVQGGGEPHGRPRLVLYGCDDLERWTELGALLTPDDPVAAAVAPANIWECPNLARIDDHWVLVVSLWRWVDQAHELAGVRYLLGDLEPQGPGWRFVASSGGVLDDGYAFYAPQLLNGPDRTLLWGWVWELGRSERQVLDDGWAGALTLPRELRIVDGDLRVRPAAELTGLRAEVVDLGADGELAPGAYEIVAGGSLRLELVLASTTEAVVAVTGRPEDPARLFIDGSIVEAYAAGRTATTRAYPTADARWRVLSDVPSTVYRLALPVG